MLLVGGARRSEVAALTMGHVEQPADGTSSEMVRLPAREACQLRHPARPAAVPVARRVTASRMGRMRRLQRGAHPDTRTRGRGDGQRGGARNWAAGTMLRETPFGAFQHRVARSRAANRG
jgi:hypothetical protein